MRVDEEERAYKKSIELCARAEQHKAGLFAKLIGRGFSVEAIHAVLPRLEQETFLDDERFCILWTRARLRQRAEGPSVILGRLIEKGISIATARRALREVDFDTVLKKAVCQELSKINTKKNNKINKPDYRIRDMVYASLRRQGFESEKISDEIEALGKNVEDMT
jgi:regulatory protein